MPGEIVFTRGHDEVLARSGVLRRRRAFAARAATTHCSTWTGVDTRRLPPLPRARHGNHHGDKMSFGMLLHQSCLVPWPQAMSVSRSFACNGGKNMKMRRDPFERSGPGAGPSMDRSAIFASTCVTTVPSRLALGLQPSVRYQACQDGVPIAPSLVRVLPRRCASRPTHQGPDQGGSFSSVPRS